MKIGIPVWGDKISPVLDTASRLLVVETDGEQESSRYEAYLDDPGLLSRCFRIKGLGVDLLICGALSRPFLRRLMASGIHIIPGISGHPEDILDAYFQGDLSDSKFLMPGFPRNIAELHGKTALFKEPKGKRMKTRSGHQGRKGFASKNRTS
ncbi:NifB/NifX family molybdenum-iron cluster-binding protein [Thermodesulfobacteriota bacterium]